MLAAALSAPLAARPPSSFQTQNLKAASWPCDPVDYRLSPHCLYTYSVLGVTAFLLGKGFRVTRHERSRWLSRTTVLQPSPLASDGRPVHTRAFLRVGPEGPSQVRSECQVSLSLAFITRPTPGRKPEFNQRCGACMSFGHWHAGNCHGPDFDTDLPPRTQANVTGPSESS